MTGNSLEDDVDDFEDCWLLFLLLLLVAAPHPTERMGFRNRTLDAAAADAAAAAAALECPAGVKMFKYKQSSDIWCGSTLGLRMGSAICQQSGPKCVASNLAGAQGGGGSGGANRKLPTGGEAYGMPPKKSMPPSRLPWTRP